MVRVLTGLRLDTGSVPLLRVAVSELVGVYFDTDCRAATPLPASVQRRAADMRIRADAVPDPGDDTAEMVAIT